MGAVDPVVVEPLDHNDLENTSRAEMKFDQKHPVRSHQPGSKLPQGPSVRLTHGATEIKVGECVRGSKGMEIRSLATTQIYLYTMLQPVAY